MSGNSLNFRGKRVSRADSMQISSFIDGSTLSQKSSYDINSKYFQFHLGEQLQQALNENGIIFSDLLDQNTTQMNNFRSSMISLNKIRNKKLLIEWFDDFNFNELLPQTRDRLKEQKARAYLKISSNDHKNFSIISQLYENLSQRRLSVKSDPDEYFWVEVQIMSYNNETELFKFKDFVHFKEHEIPSIQINFGNETTDEFVKRVKKALKLRVQCQSKMKYELILDCLTVDDIPTLKNILIQRILKKSRIENQDNLVNFIEEINLHYKRVQAELQLKSSHKSNPEYAKELFNLIDEASQSLNRKKIQLNYDFNSIREKFRLHSIYCQPEVKQLVQFIKNSCDQISQLNLFLIDSDHIRELPDFDDQQKQKIQEITSFLQEEWPNTISQYVFNTLKHIDIGWFDIRVNKWDVYLKSKLSRFMKLTRFKMQEAIKTLIINSIKLYSDWLCTPCQGMLDVQDDFEWNENFNISPFDYDKPIFYLVLHMDEERGAYFESIDFGRIILQNFDAMIYNTHFIKLVDPLVLKNLKFEPKLFLSSIGLLDQRITKPRAYIKVCYEKAVIPLNAYARRFNEHLAFFVLDVTAFIDEMRKKSVLEIKEEILLNMRLKQELEEKLPEIITIGPFYVLVHPLKNLKLIRKRNEIIQKLTVMLNEKIREKTKNVVNQYENMYRRLYDPPPNVEFAYETQAWLETLPNVVKATEDQMRLVLYDYEVLDFFKYYLSLDDFKLKWDAISWPAKILAQINIVHEILLHEIEKFQKQQVTEVIAFDKVIESLTVQIQEFQTKNDISKALENAKQCKSLADQLRDAKMKAITLNKRQISFDWPELDLENIDRLIYSIKPYETLWYTAANFYRNRENWLNQHLDTLNVHEIFETVENSKNIFLELVDDFQELPEIRKIPQSILKEIRDFESILDLIHDLTHISWKPRQYGVLNDQTNMSILYDKHLNLKTCIEQGIMSYRESVKLILKQAIEKSLQEESDKVIQAEHQRKEEEILEARRQRRLARTDI